MLLCRCFFACAFRRESETLLHFSCLYSRLLVLQKGWYYDVYVYDVYMYVMYMYMMYICIYVYDVYVYDVHMYMMYTVLCMCVLHKTNMLHFLF